MRIWIVNQYAIALDQAGGTRHSGLARELVRRGHEVVLISSSFDYFTRTETRLEPGEHWRVENEEGVYRVWLRVPGYSVNSLGRLWSMMSFARNVLRYAKTWPVPDPDIVVGSTPHLFAPYAAERIAHRANVPFVLEVRDLWPQSLVDVGGVSPRHPIVKGMECIERYLYRHADWSVSLLPGAAPHMVSRGARANRFSWLPNGVDLGLVPKPTHPPSDGPFTVIYAGQHGVANALDSLLDAAAILKREGRGDQIHFRFFGAGTEKPRLEERARTEGLTNVEFREPVSKDRIYDELARGHAFIATLRNIELYRFGISLNKIYDYMAMARPTVFGARAFNNPIDEADAGITVPPEDAAAMATAVIRLADMDFAERWQMGLRGRRFAELNYDTRQLAGRLEAVLAHVIALAKGQAATEPLDPIRALGG